MVQFFDGNWASNPQFIYEGVTDFQFNFRDITGQFSGAQVTPFVIPAATLSTLKTTGLIIQGYGATLTKVVLVDVSEAGLRDVARERHEDILFDLMGRRIDQAPANGLFIRDGKKVAF